MRYGREIGCTHSCVAGSGLRKHTLSDQHTIQLQQSRRFGHELQHWRHALARAGAASRAGAGFACSSSDQYTIDALTA